MVAKPIPVIEVSGTHREVGQQIGEKAKSCTDFAAVGQATTDGSTLVAHTNDLPPETEEDLVILRVRAGDDPEFLGVSVAGLGFSAGFNAAGISMTGNAVSCSDIRPGVPRMLIARAILAARRLGEAMDACLLPLRASNYNNVIADPNGDIYNMDQHHHQSKRTARLDRARASVPDNLH